MLTRHRAPLALALAVTFLAIGLAACGGSDDSDDGTDTPGAATAPTTAGGGSEGEVSVQMLGSAGEVLVDSAGSALYTNDKDRGSKIACTAECAEIWVPLEAPSAGEPSSGDAAVQSRLGTVRPPDGTAQVTLDGLPLYSFTEDPAGEVTGDGFVDQFSGTTFTWTVARSSGTSTDGDSDSDSDVSTDGGGGIGY